jgi:hypothetical protein
LDVTHLIVAAVALLVPVVFKRLQTPATPAPPTPAPAPALPTDVAALLPFHGALVNLVLKLLEQQTPQPTK